MEVMLCVMFVDSRGEIDSSMLVVSGLSKSNVFALFRYKGRS